MSLIRKGALSFGGTMVRTVFATLTGVLLSRWLGPDGIGQYQLVISMVTLVATVANLGVAQASVYFINNRREPIEKVTISSLAYGIFSGIVVAIVIFFALQIESFFGHISLWTKVMLSAGIIVLSCYISLLQTFVALLAIRRLVFLKTLKPAMLLIGAALIVLAGVVDVDSALIVNISAFLIPFPVLIWLLRSYIGHYTLVSLQLIWQMIGFGVQVSAFNIIHLININLGLYMVRYFMHDDFTSVGHYGRATAVANMLMLIAISVGPLFYSRWSGLQLKERLFQVAFASRLLLLIGLGLAIPIFIFAKWIIVGLYGAEFIAAVTPLRILVLAVGLRFMISPTAQLFSSSGHPYWNIVVVGLILTVMSVSMYFLVPTYHIVGAAIAVTLSNLSGFALGYGIAKWKYDLPLLECFAIRWADTRYVWRKLLKRS